VLIVPATSRLRQTSYHVSFIHEGGTYGAVISQIRLISTKRLKRKIFRMDSDTFANIVRAIQHMVADEKDT